MTPGERNLTQWNRREGWIHLAVLCRGYHGASTFRLWLRSLPLGMPEREKEDLIKTDHAAMECIPKDRRGRIWTTGYGFATPKRITWW